MTHKAEKNGNGAMGNGDGDEDGRHDCAPKRGAASESPAHIAIGTTPLTKKIATPRDGDFYTYI